LIQRVAVNKRARDRVKSGNLWVYKSDIPDFDRYREFERGSVVDITDERDRFIARGYFNYLSQISLRVLSNKENIEINDNFWRGRLADALNRRKSYFDFKKTGILRLVFSEADLLPGLIVDMYGGIIVIQALSAGAEKFIETTVSFFEKELKPETIYIKNDAEIRKLEGLELYVKFIGNKPAGPVSVCSDGIFYIIDIAGGQKTGFFADQRRAYAELDGNVTGGRVLDCFSYVGSFSMNAFKYGARESVLVDISESAIENARETAKLNKVYDKCSFIAANAFDYLKEESKKAKTGKYSAKEYFDFVILDPPTFTKSKAGLPKALAGYKEIALRAVSLMKKKSKLLTCTCSHHVGAQDFYQSQCDAFKDGGVLAYMLRAGFQDERDHPILCSMPETLYLKYYMFQIF